VIPFVQVVIPPPIISMPRAIIIVATIIRVGINAPVVVISVLGIVVAVVVIPVSIVARRLIPRPVTKSEGETLSLRCVWRRGQNSQYRDYRGNKIFHDVPDELDGSITLPIRKRGHRRFGLLAAEFNALERDEALSARCPTPGPVSTLSIGRTCCAVALE
jgi:hypothetical protein